MKKEGKGWFWFIIAIAIILRCLFIQQRGIQYDDAFSMLLSQRTLGEIISGTAADTMPPLYYFLLHFWVLISYQIWFVRLLSVVFNLVCGILVYKVAQQLVSRNGALIALFLFSISPLQIYHAQDLRMYALCELAQVSYLYFFILLFVHQNTTSRYILWTGLVLSGVTTLYSHNLGGMVLIIPSIYLLIKRQWRNLYHLAIAQLGILFLFIPWLLVLPGQIAKIQHSFWTPRPGLVEILQASMLMVATLPLHGLWITAGLTITLAVMALIGVGLYKFRNETHSIGLPLLVWLGLPAIIFIISHFMRPIYVVRGFLISSSFFYIVAAWLIAKEPRKIGVLISVGFILAAIISLPYQYLFSSFPRSSFQQAAAYLAKSELTDSVILHDNKLSLFPFTVYQPDLPETFLPDVPGSFNDTLAVKTQKALNLFPAENVQSAAQGKKIIYFVVFQNTIDEYLAAGKTNHPTITWLSEHFTKSEAHIFGDLLVIPFSAGISQ